MRYYLLLFLMIVPLTSSLEVGTSGNISLNLNTETTSGGGSFTNASYVPYTGATGDVYLGNNDIHYNISYPEKIGILDGDGILPIGNFSQKGIGAGIQTTNATGNRLAQLFSFTSLINYTSVGAERNFAFIRAIDALSAQSSILRVYPSRAEYTSDFLIGGDLDVEGDVTAPNVCYSNGTNCVTPPTSNPFDQDLNTTDDVQFNQVDTSKVIAQQYYGAPSNNGQIIFNASGGTSAYSDQLIFNGNAFPSYWRVDAPSRQRIFWNVDFQLAGGKKMSLGSGSNTEINVENSYTNDSTQIGTVTNFAGFSGVVGIMSRIGMGNANRQPNDIFVDPHLRLWGGSRGQTTDNMDWMDLYYNVSGQNGYIDVGDGGLVITSNTTFQERTFMTAPNGSVYNCGPDNSGTWSCSHT